ncbi:MAG TPA: methionyl-tRNA formyltransferase [Syntrophorhabdales bacterium]|nr:methionyl-tRNA formyltransferase [Syntrophorhabdales bacterium]
MRILFFGSSSFSVFPLESIYSLVSAVVTKKAKPRGRGYLLEDGEVAQLARRLKLPLFEIDSFKDPAARDLAALKPDLLVVVSFGLLIPKWFLDVPIIGAINVHPSLLPKYRGPAPIQWAIRDGESETGITIIKMSERMDAGDILYQEPFSIRAGEDARGLSERLSQRTAQILLGFLKGVETDGLPQGTVQREEDATYTPIITREMGLISWATDAIQIVRQVRALVVWPTAYTFLDGKLVKVFAADLGHRTEESEPGIVLEVLPDGLLVASLSGSVLLKEVQLENRRRMSASEFARGYRGAVGKRFS